MPEPGDFDTTDLRGWLDRLRAGDPAARDDILRAAQARLEAMISRMLRRQPPVARWADTGDLFAAAAAASCGPSGTPRWPTPGGSSTWPPGASGWS
jgi:hypothetical protein